jgi:hypothetical protein
MTTIRSASRSASSRYCVVSSTVVPSAVRASIVSPHAETAPRVQARGRLVEEEHRRAEDQSSGEIEPPAHAARVGLRGPLGGVREVEALQQLAGAGSGLRAPEVIEPADHLEVLEPGEVFVHGGVLAGQADLGAERGRVAHGVEPDDPSAARVWLKQGGQDPHRGGLAGAVRSQQAEDAASARGEVDATEGADRSVRLLEPLDDDCVIAHHLEASEGSAALWFGYTHHSFVNSG